MAFPTREDLQSSEVNKAIFEQLLLAFWTTLPDYRPIGENANIRLFEDHAFPQLILQITTWILDGHKTDRLVPTEIEVPKTWWDHWKLEHGPKWLIRKWPVEYKTISVTKEIHQHYVCPHISAKDERWPHIEWMYKASGQQRKSQ